MTHKPEPTKNDTIGITLRRAPTTPPKPTPTPIERHQHATAARDRLREAKAEAFKPSQQYRPAGDSAGHVGTGEA